MWGVFIHYLGYMVSSGVVLVTGILLHFISGDWTLYIDPVASLLIVGLILWTTIPLVRDCSMILLQGTPAQLELGLIRRELKAVEGVESVHDLHVWQLSEGKAVGSAHISVEEGIDFKRTLEELKEVFHLHGIHSTTIQPEYVPKNTLSNPYCEENCVEDCEEDWCCKKTAERIRREMRVQGLDKGETGHKHGKDKHKHKHTHEEHDNHHDDEGHDHNHDGHDHDGHDHNHDGGNDDDDLLVHL